MRFYINLTPTGEPQSQFEDDFPSHPVNSTYFDSKAYALKIEVELASRLRKWYETAISEICGQSISLPTNAIDVKIDDDFLSFTVNSPLIPFDFDSVYKIVEANREDFRIFEFDHFYALVPNIVSKLDQLESLDGDIRLDLLSRFFNHAIPKDDEAFTELKETFPNQNYQDLLETYINITIEHEKEIQQWAYQSK